jgi:regulator of sirC expression with transglutaminase-like and TPR domain
VQSFADIARLDSPHLDQLALAISAELRPTDCDAALAELDRLAELVVREGLGGEPHEQLAVLEEVLGRREGLLGDVEDYDNPDNSMLDLVLSRRRGLPILLSVVWVEVGRRLGMPLRGVGLPGHYVAGWFGDGDPILVDPFRGGALIADAVAPAAAVPTSPHLTALRMCSNLVAAYERRGDIGRMLTAARLRLELPLDERDRRVMEFEFKRLSARTN